MINDPKQFSGDLPTEQGHSVEAAAEILDDLENQGLDPLGATDGEKPGSIEGTPNQANGRPEEEGGLPQLDEATLAYLAGDQQGSPAPAEAEKGEGASEGRGAPAEEDLAKAAELLGFSREDLSYDPETGVRIKTKVDGEEGWVSPAEQRKSYQLQAHLTRQQEEFARTRQAWEQAKQTREQEFDMRAQVAGKFVETQEKALHDAYASVDWGRLRDEDPQEYLLQQNQYNTQVAALRNQRMDIEQAVEEENAKRQKEYQEQASEMAVMGARQLAQEFGWADENTFNERAQQLTRYLVESRGFRPEEVMAVTDGRALVLAEKARLYDQMQERIAKARTRVAKTPPPLQKVGSSRSGGAPNGKREAMKRIREAESTSAQIDAAADYFQEIGFG